MLLKGITTGAAVLAAITAALNTLWLLPLYFIGYFAALFLAAAAYCAVICAFVDMKKPAEQDSPFYRANMYVYIEFLMNILRVKVKATGLEKTPREGRFLLVCNHQAMADPGILLHFFRKSQLAFISKKENEKLPLINKFLHKTMCQSIERENDRQGLRVILKCIDMIKKDQVSVAVFPEGYTTKDGKVHRFRPGAFKIAQKTQVPIVVCTINGTMPLFHNLKTYSKTCAQLHLVDVIQPEQYACKTTAEISDMVYEIMIADLGEEFRAAEPPKASPERGGGQP